MNPMSFHQIIEAKLSELVELEAAADASGLCGIYVQVLILYLQGDAAALRRLHGELLEGRHPGLKACSAGETRFLLAITRLRFAIRERSIDGAALDEALAAARPDPAWEAEAHFVVGMAHEVLENHALCKEHNKIASRRLDEVGAARKALKAFHNYVAAEGRLNPDRKLLAEFHAIYSRARKLRENVVAGLAMNNIAQQYREIGAHLSALKCINKALIHLKADTGSLHYYLALLNRCHILLDLGRASEARLDLDQARISGFREIQSAMQVLEMLVSSKAVPEESRKDMYPTWKERLEHAISGQDPGGLSPQEDQLIRLLSERSRDKFELMRALFGDRLNVESAENRLKNLFVRVRKKRPGLLVLEGGRYRIADAVFLEAV